MIVANFIRVGGGFKGTFLMMVVIVMKEMPCTNECMDAGMDGSINE